MGLHRYSQLGTLVISGLILSACSHSPVAQRNDSQSLPRAMASDGGPIPVDQIKPNENPYSWPVRTARMTRGFIPRKRHPHLGLDLAAPRGTPIMAARSGTVIYKGRGFHGYGRMVMIEATDGSATLYAHLDKFFVKEGQKIARGEVIGAMGRSGHATGVHLHFEVRSRSGAAIDPLTILPAKDSFAQNQDEEPKKQ